MKIKNLKRVYVKMNGGCVCECVCGKMTKDLFYEINEACLAKRRIAHENEPSFLHYDRE